MSLVTDIEVLNFEEEQRQDYKSLGEYITVDDKIIDLTTGLQDYNYIWDASNRMIEGSCNNEVHGNTQGNLGNS
jgi:hypothetical protein